MVRACISTAPSPAHRWVYISHAVQMCIYRMYTLQGGERYWLLPLTGAACPKLQASRPMSPGSL